MINSIQPSQPNKTVKTSIFIMNDFHAKLPNLERAYTASRMFDSFESSADKLKLSSGDDGLGEDPVLSKAVSKMLGMIGITKRQNGNHEFDVNPALHAEIAKDAKYQELGAVNIHVKPESALNSTMVRSAIEEHNGNKYGIVGIGPSDMFTRLKDGVSKADLTVDDLETTIVNLQKEVSNLKSQGVNKIILLSHSGYTNDVKIAQQTSGIDVIVGGHSHDLIKGVETGKNLFYNKDNEPVIITQCGKDGEYFGILNLEFDENGIIKSVQNNVIPTNIFNRTLPAKHVVEEIIGKPEHVGIINSAPPTPKNRLIENNPHGNFLVDAMRKELGADIALLNSANIRGYFEKGKVDTRKVAEITPFKNKLVITKINEKELVDAIKLGGKSFLDPWSKPGIVLVSGLKYTMNDKGELLKLSYVDDNGNVTPIDINNPNQNKVLRVAMDDFYATGGDGFSMLNKKHEAEAVFDFDKDKLACDYIKKQDKPIDITDDKRIEIVKS